MVVLAPRDELARRQLRLVGALAAADGHHVEWVEARRTPRDQIHTVWQQGRRAASAERLVIGDPFSGLVQLFTQAAPHAQLVVVDDGTSTLRYADAWARSEPLVRWHQSRLHPLARPVGRLARRRLGNRRGGIELFTAMLDESRTELPVTRNHYPWTRSRFGPPEIVAGTDLLGSSLVETGVIDGQAYLAGIADLRERRQLRRYLPHRREADSKVAAIAALGLEIVRPELPMEVYARRGPVSQTLLSFPSTVLTTLPLVLAGSGVRVEALPTDDSWFRPGTPDSARDFVRRIG